MGTTDSRMAEFLATGEDSKDNKIWPNPCSVNDKSDCLLESQRGAYCVSSMGSAGTREEVCSHQRRKEREKNKNNKNEFLQYPIH